MCEPLSRLGGASQTDPETGERTGDPTAAYVIGLAAHRTARGVRIGWRTASEVGVLGFVVWRSTGALGPYRRLTGRLIDASSGATGHEYRYLDRSARPGHSFRYGVIRLDETVRWWRIIVVGRY